MWTEGVGAPYSSQPQCLRVGDLKAAKRRQIERAKMIKNAAQLTGFNRSEITVG